MTKLDFLSLIPFMILAGAPVIMMILVIISRNLKVIYGFSLLMFIAAFLSLFIVTPGTPVAIGSLLIIDSYGVLFLGIIYIAAIVIIIISYDYLLKQGGEREEYFIMLFVAFLGASVLVVADHFISFFLGLELLSISLYVLIGYLRSRDFSIEAAVKFLVIASLATAFLLFGMGLVYAETGSMSFRQIGNGIENTGTFPLLVLLGFGLIITGIGFKLALVPFHMWAPDVYQGAPVPVTTFIATVSKAAVLALGLRFFINMGGPRNDLLVLIVSAISVLSMFTGNLLALRQTNIKRLLAYSSIAHMGYLLIPMVAGTKEGIAATLFYIIAYILTSLGAFAVISVLSVCERDADSTEDIKGLFWSNPMVAILLSLAFFSLAGLPLTAGFISKFYLALAGVRSGLWILVISLIVNSAISLYYYLRVIRSMLSEPLHKGAVRFSPLIAITLLIITAGILFLGILPSFVTELISSFSMII